MNKVAQQLSNYVQFGSTLFVTIILFLLLREPLINPMIDEAIGSVTNPFTAVVIKLIPLVFIFFLVLVIVSVLRRRG